MTRRRCGSEAILARVKRVLAWKPKDENRLCSLHAPKVECFSKGKARHPYEFYVKVTEAMHKEGLIVGMRSIPGNSYPTTGTRCRRPSNRFASWPIIRPRSYSSARLIAESMSQAPRFGVVASNAASRRRSKRLFSGAAPSSHSSGNEKRRSLLREPAQGQSRRCAARVLCAPVTTCAWSSEPCSFAPSMGGHSVLGYAKYEMTSSTSSVLNNVQHPVYKYKLSISGRWDLPEMR